MAGAILKNKGRVVNILTDIRCHNEIYFGEKSHTNWWGISLILSLYYTASGLPLTEKSTWLWSYAPSNLPGILDPPSVTNTGEWSVSNMSPSAPVLCMYYTTIDLFGLCPFHLLHKLLFVCLLMEIFPTNIIHLPYPFADIFVWEMLFGILCLSMQCFSNHCSTYTPSWMTGLTLDIPEQSTTELIMHGASSKMQIWLGVRVQPLSITTQMVGHVCALAIVICSDNVVYSMAAYSARSSSAG